MPEHAWQSDVDEAKAAGESSQAAGRRGDLSGQQRKG